jgi:hypothetical protein
MLLRAYSILGTLMLVLCVASPALARGKKKAHSQDSAQTAADTNAADKASDEPESKSEQRSAKKKKGKKSDEEASSDDKKGSKKGDKKAADKSDKDEAKPATAGEGEAGATDTAAAEAELPDDKVWEKPPEEKEKPKPADVAPVVEKKGDGRPWSAGIEAGYGLKTDRRTGGFGADPYGLSAGLRAGYEFPFMLYVGVWFNWYLGSSETGSAARINLAQSTTHANYWQFGADVGYDWWIASVIIRPSMEIGEAIAVSDALGRTVSTGDFMVSPGLTVVYPWDNLFLAGEFRGNIVTGDGVGALLIAVQLGMRFQD